MRRSPPLLVALAAAAAVAAPVAVALPKITFVPASPANYAHGTRPASAIQRVVVHVAEGTYWGTIDWFRNPRARSSAHYVVSRDGAVTQMVANSRIAWHSGNGWMNRHSIGVEHEAFTNVIGTVTDAEYRASAEVVASLLRRYVLPIDRRHVIGHNEVPDPFRPWLTGGYSHHTDPGKYWDWRRYLDYVRAYARGAVPPPVFDVTTSGVRFGDVVAGTLQFAPLVTGAAAARVDVLLDGRVRGSGSLALDTTLLPNGRHVLTARAVSADGRTAASSVVFAVKNVAVKITGLTLTNGQTVSGVVRWGATVTGAPARVELAVDGAVRATLTQKPYGFDWDTMQETAGPHTLTVRAFRSDGKLLATRTLSVVVANTPTP